MWNFFDQIYLITVHESSDQNEFIQNISSVGIDKIHIFKYPRVGNVNVDKNQNNMLDLLTEKSCGLICHDLFILSK